MRKSGLASKDKPSANCIARNPRLQTTKTQKIAHFAAGKNARPPPFAAPVLTVAAAMASWSKANAWCKAVLIAATQPQGRQ
jgi:hypothetical protein